MEGEGELERCVIEILDEGHNVDGMDGLKHHDLSSEKGWGGLFILVVVALVVLIVVVVVVVLEVVVVVLMK